MHVRLALVLTSAITALGCLGSVESEDAATPPPTPAPSDADFHFGHNPALFGACDGKCPLTTPLLARARARVNLDTYRDSLVPYDVRTSDETIASATLESRMCGCVRSDGTRTTFGYGTDATPVPSYCPAGEWAQCSLTIEVVTHRPGSVALEVRALDEAGGAPRVAQIDVVEAVTVVAELTRVRPKRGGFSVRLRDAFPATPDGDIELHVGDIAALFIHPFDGEGRELFYDTDGFQITLAGEQAAVADEKDHDAPGYARTFRGATPGAVTIAVANGSATDELSVHVVP